MISVLRTNLSACMVTLLACGGVVDASLPASDDDLDSGSNGGSVPGGGGEGSGGSDTGGAAQGGSIGTGNAGQGGSDPELCPERDDSDYGFWIEDTTVAGERLTGWCVVAVEPADMSERAFQFTCGTPDGGTHEITLHVQGNDSSGGSISLSLFDGQAVYVDFEKSSPWWVERWLTVSGYSGNILIQAVQASDLTSPSGLSPLGFAQPISGLCEIEDLGCGMGERIGADVENPAYGDTLRIFDGQYTADVGSHLEYFVGSATVLDPNGVLCSDTPLSWWSVLGGFGVTKCGSPPGCGGSLTCDEDTSLFYPTTCLATNCDAPIGYCNE